MPARYIELLPDNFYLPMKVDERIPPMVDDFLYVCDDAYTRDQLMKMERKMLGVVGFDLGYSLSYRFVMTWFVIFCKYC